MNEVFRVCPNCGGDVAMAARHCGACGYNTQDGYPLERRGALWPLTEVVAKAALPVAAGLTGLALRAGWQLLRKQLPTLAANALSRRAAAPPAVRPAQPRAGQFIRIRSKWAIGDRNGVWRAGEEEHIIEVDDSSAGGR